GSGRTSPYELWIGPPRASGLRNQRPLSLASRPPDRTAETGTAKRPTKPGPVLAACRIRRREVPEMTTRLSRERAVTAALDQLHTPATELARFASKTPVDADPASTVRNPSSAARRARSRVRRSRRTTSSPPRWRSFAVLGAVLLTG